jgi:hypothetical protein
LPEIQVLEPIVRRFHSTIKTNPTMKVLPLMLLILLAAFAGHAQSTYQQRLQAVQAVAPPIGLPPGAPPSFATYTATQAAKDAAKDAANYLIRVEWHQTNSDVQSLEVLTAEGHFELDSIQKSSVKINNSEIPITLKFNGNLTALSDDKGRLQLYLGRTVPYVTGSGGMGGFSSYSQMNVGLDSTFLVKFDTPVVIQTDENGQISVLVKRIEM